MPKNIVVCCDGTWNRFDKKLNTNVSKLCYCLKRHTEEQVVYYDPGVGTIAAEHIRTKVGSAASKVLAGAFGFGVGQNLAEAYGFIQAHYRVDDRIFLFGFSRGAYTVRALASVLRYLGLLERHNDNLYPYMKEIFAAKGRGGGPDFELFSRFKRNFARPVRVHFVGVWDTVSSVGWLHSPVSVPATATNPEIDHIRHAVAIDERRKNFRHNLFNAATDTQDVRQVWFSGAHADVGGGYEEAECGLSKISLRWMLREAEECERESGGGLLVDGPARQRMLGENNDDYSKPDPLAKLHDPFEEFKWRAAQWPPRRSYRQVNGKWEGYWDWSIKPKERFIDPKAVIHRSVKQRWEAVPSYRPPNLGNLDEHPVEE